jgi:hypothetical protein
MSDYVDGINRNGWTDLSEYTPDHLRGAYVLRNGLQDALSLYRPDIRPRTVLTAAYAGLRFADAPISVTENEGSVQVQCFDCCIFLYGAESGTKSFSLPHALFEPLSPTSYRLTPRRDSTMRVLLGIVTPEGVRIAGAAP